jgi:polyhydroxybutyrate depolymerase
LPPIDASDQFTDQGQLRTYTVHTPQIANRPLPLIIALHGSQESGQQMTAKTGLNQLGDQAGFVVVYPDGLNQKWNVSGIASEDNVAFVHTLIDRVQKIRTIDPTRIYVVGLSNGGILAQKIACDAPQGIAAFATVAASLPQQFQSTCQTKTPISMLMINGTTDPIVPWQGGKPPQVRVGRDLTLPPIPEVVSFWQQHDACPAQPIVTQLNQRVQISDSPHCQKETEVSLIAMKGAGHIWAGSGGVSPYLSATQAVWQFLQRQHLPA